MKKRQVRKFSHVRERLFKILLLMKLTAFVLLIGCLQVHAKGFSQQKISVTLNNVGIKSALLSIQQSSKYRFVYNDDLLPGDVRITVKASNAKIEDVLNDIFENTSLIYKILANNLIVISLPGAQMKKPITVTGNVRLRNKDGQSGPHADISVLEKGSTNGTTTNTDGAFTINVSDANAVLVISYVGYATTEVALQGKTSVEVILETDEKELQGVVVTALGITRQKKSITYATQSLKGSDLSETRQVNLTSAMNGKVAGLTINKTNSGPGGSNRIVFRGNRSIANSNQPLVVVDGVRVDNSAKAGADVALFGARDNGDGISNINPDDVESMTVLTGASAAALYGSDASNGVIMITTKKGQAGKGIGVQLSSSITMEKPMAYPKFQNVYGQGSAGLFDKGSEFSWGAKMDGQNVEDWTGKTQSLSPQGNNFKDFFQTGTELINSVAISTGTTKSQTYFSYTNTSSKGIIPENDYKRNNLNLRQTVNLTDKLSFDFKANYIGEIIGNRPLSGAGNRVMSTLYAMPRSLRLGDIKNFETLSLDGDLTQNYWATEQKPDFQNPYWSVYRNIYERKRNRFIGLAAVKYQFTPELSIQLRSSLDYYADISEEKDYNNTFWLTDYPGQGNYVLSKESNKQFNNDVLINFNKNLSPDFSLNVNAGASLEQFNFERTTQNTQGLSVPNLFSVTNAVSLSPVVNNYIPYVPIVRTEKQSLYGAAQLGYKNYLFLDITGRNDWNSTLPVKNSSYFFPSAGLSAVLSDMFTMPAFSLLKLRTSYAYVGNGTGFNQIKPSFSLVPGGNGGFLLIDRTLRNPDLKPEQTRSFEAGIDMGFFKNRLTAEFTYYKTNTKNQILTIPVPEPSGYANRIINAGNIQNQGIELLLNARPVSSKDFKWNIGITFGSNKNKIIELDSLQKEPYLSSPQSLGAIIAKEGAKYGEIYTSSLMRNTQGYVVVNADGLPIVESAQTHYVGNYNPDWTGGVSNTFQYKSWSLSFLVDMRKGGVFISGTQALMASKGTSEQTLSGRETNFVIPNSVTEDGSKNTVAVGAQQYWMWVTGNSVGELFTYDATNARLREASITYTLPSKLLGKSFVKGASLSVIGRNLFFITNKAGGIDPESSLGTGNNQGIEYSSIPTTRSYGLYLKLNF